MFFPFSDRQRRIQLSTFSGWSSWLTCALIAPMALTDIFFFKLIPMRASFPKHHDPNFVNFPRVETLCQKAFIPKMVACRGEDCG